MSLTYPFNVPSGTVITPRVSGNASLGTSSFPFSGIYVNNIYGSNSLSVRTVSGTQSLATSDSVILGDTTPGDFTLTLPNTSGISGKYYNIKKISGDANVLTVSGTSGQTIDDSAIQQISSQYNSMTIVTNGSNWFII